MAQITVQKQYSLNLADGIKALILAVAAPVLATIEQSFEAGSLTFNWKLIAITAGSAAIAYLTKNYLTPTQTVLSNQTEAEKPVVVGNVVTQPEIKSQPK
jgi:hypothetical protein